MFCLTMKNRKKYLSKMLPRLCSPPPTPVMGLSYGLIFSYLVKVDVYLLYKTPNKQTCLSVSLGSRVSAEFYPHWSTRTRQLQCALVAIPLYLRQKASFASLWEHFFYSHVLVPSLFRSSAVVNFHFLCPKSASVLSSCYSW